MNSSRSSSPEPSASYIANRSRISLSALSSAVRLGMVLSSACSWDNSLAWTQGGGSGGGQGTLKDCVQGGTYGLCAYSWGEGQGDLLR